MTRQVSKDSVEEVGSLDLSFDFDWENRTDDEKADIRDFIYHISGCAELDQRVETFNQIADHPDLAEFGEIDEIAKLLKQGRFIADTEGGGKRLETCLRMIRAQYQLLSEKYNAKLLSQRNSNNAKKRDTDTAERVLRIARKVAQTKRRPQVGSIVFQRMNGEITRRRIGQILQGVDLSE